MSGIIYYFNDAYQNIEIKECDSVLHSSKAHFHNEISLGLIERGRCKVELYGKSYELVDKVLLIIPPEVIHKCNPDDYTEWVFKMIYLKKEWFDCAFGVESQKMDFLYKKLDKASYSEAIQLIKAIEKFQATMESESTLLNNISSLIKIKEGSFYRIEWEQIDKVKMRMVRDYLNEHYQENVMLDQLEKLSGLSKYYIIRQFENCYGISPHQYLTNLRVNSAKHKLRKKDTLAKIASEAGFYDQSHFTKSFKEYTGLTPMKYKRHIEQ